MTSCNVTRFDALRAFLFDISLFRAVRRWENVLWWIELQLADKPDQPANSMPKAKEPSLTAGVTPLRQQGQSSRDDE